MTKFTHLLVPVDFEASSQRALDTAVDLAILFDARLTVVHAWDIPSNAYPAMLALSPEIWQSLAEAAEQALQSTFALRIRPAARATAVPGAAKTRLLRIS
jgi:nucleotide-binding universal stress UspA family protein